MEDLNRAGRLIRFGVFEIDRQARELRRAGQRIPLQIQPFRVLEVLIDRAGDVVTRAELRTRIWPSTVYVDFDHGLNNAINRLRHALEDSADAPRFIETLPHLGYRFIHALEQSRAEPRPPPGTQARRLATLQVGIAAAVVLITGLVVIGIEGEPNRSTVGKERPTASVEANDAYLRGLKLFEQRSKESVKLSIEELKRATELDPNFAAAHAALAVAYAGAGGNTLMQFVSTDVAIEQSYRRALELDPTNASAYLYLGNFLSTRGRSEAAVPQYRRALEFDPLSPSINSRLGMELIGLGKTEEGLGYLRKTVALEPWQFNARLRLGWGYVTLGDLDEAERAFEAAERISPNSVRSQAGLAFVAARKGDTARARAVLDAVLPLAADLEDPFDVAIIYVGLEDRENSIEWLARTARQTRTLHMRSPWGIQMPLYHWLRADPKFAEIEREIAATSGAGNR